MKRNLFYGAAAILMILLTAAAYQFFRSGTAKPVLNPVSETCGDSPAMTVNSDPSFMAEYARLDLSEKNFSGILEKNEASGETGTAMRSLPYRLDGKPVYTFDDLSKYVGKKVVMVGINYKFELEGEQRDEIWPINIACE